jgi:hypothetical protein
MRFPDQPNRRPARADERLPSKISRTDCARHSAGTGVFPAAYREFEKRFPRKRLRARACGEIFNPPETLVEILSPSDKQEKEKQQRERQAEEESEEKEVGGLIWIPRS